MNIIADVIIELLPQICSKLPPKDYYLFRELLISVPKKLDKKLISWGCGRNGKIARVNGYFIVLVKEKSAMTKTKVFLPTTQIRNGRAIITGDDVHHLRLVLRKQVNDQLLVAVDGQTYCGIIRQLDSNQIVVELGAKLSECAESPVFVRLYQGMPKGDKLDLIIQKQLN